MAVRPTIVRNPPDDRAFEEQINTLLDDAADDPAVLQQRLRKLYPRAVVRPRELAGEPLTVWYVYRDGRWVPREREGSQGER